MSRLDSIYKEFRQQTTHVESIKKALAISGFIALNNSFLKDSKLSAIFEKGDKIFSVNWDPQVQPQFVDLLLSIFIEVEADPIFLYGYFNTWGQEFAGNPTLKASETSRQKLRFWEELRDYTQIKINELEFDDELHEEADRFFILWNGTITDEAIQKRLKKPELGDGENRRKRRAKRHKKR